MSATVDEQPVAFLPVRKKITPRDKRRAAPIPTTRAEADVVFGTPGAIWRARLASTRRLYTLNKLGRLAVVESAAPITNERAHQAILDAMYGPEAAPEVHERTLNHRLVSACVECGGRATENHHVVPRSRGGSFTVPLCGSCHGKAHNIRRSDDIPVLTAEGLERARGLGITLGRPRSIPPATLALITQLRGEGLSLAAIAQRLNEDGIPTVRGGSQWWPSAIHKVVRR